MIDHDADLAYIRQLRDIRQAIALHFEVMHGALRKAELLEVLGLPLRSTPPLTPHELRDWRRRDHAAALAGCTPEQQAIAKAQLDAAEALLVQHFSFLAAYCNDNDMRDREGEAWALIQGFAGLPEDGVRFFERYAHVPDFGWMRREKAERFAAGELPKGDKWQPAAEANARHSEWDSAWEIGGEHWKLRGNIDYHVLRRLLVLLEAEYDFFLLTFADELPLAKPIKRLEMYIFKDQNEYREQYRKHTEREAGFEGGRYDSATNRSYFFYYDNSGEQKRDIGFDAVCLHEACHQLFDLLTEQKIGLAVDQPHFWIIEGIPEYFSLLRLRGMHAYPPLEADLRASGRWPRMRQMIDGAALTPLKNYTAFAQRDFYATAGGGLDHYVQAATLTWYLMDRHRDGMMDYVKAVMIDAKGGKIRFDQYFPETKKCELAFLEWLLAQK